MKQKCKYKKPAISLARAEVEFAFSERGRVGIVDLLNKEGGPQMVEKVLAYDRYKYGGMHGKYITTISVELDRYKQKNENYDSEGSWDGVANLQ
jgi:hypothetical protein